MPVSLFLYLLYLSSLSIDLFFKNCLVDYSHCVGLQLHIMLDDIFLFDGPQIVMYHTCMHYGTVESGLKQLNYTIYRPTYSYL